jgi:integrase
MSWVDRWYETSTLSRKTRQIHRSLLTQAGRWMAAESIAAASPDLWTREICAAWVARVDRLQAGDYAQSCVHVEARVGQPLLPASKAMYLSVTRRFFHDCQEWGWIKRHFDPRTALATPRSVKNLIGPNPRVIADDIWAKLLWAGVNLEPADLIDRLGREYPFELLRAVTMTWLFGGLRSDELARLRLGCIRWMDGGEDGSGGSCLLDVPVHKTGTAFTKPVDALVGHAIARWEAVRPAQPRLPDRKTGERVDLLFAYRFRRVAPNFVNRTVIPILCRKAGVPREDVRGRITSHRARSTIATQLYNAKEPMTLFELQAWLGHRSVQSTQRYTRITPTELSRAYDDAGYFARNVRTIEVLIDRGAVLDGTAAAGAPWQHYDLGHGYCGYTFFEQCPHRMACARCDFYIPKPSAKALLLEAKSGIDRRLALIPLTDGERAAVEQDQQALGKLLDGLPTRRPQQARHPARSPRDPRFSLVSLIPYNQHQPRSRQVLDQPLGHDPRHHLVSVMDPPPALIPQREGQRLLHLLGRGGAEIGGIGHRGGAPDARSEP